MVSGRKGAAVGGAYLGATCLLCCVLGIAALVDGHHGGWHGLMVTALMTVAPTVEHTCSY